MADPSQGGAAAAQPWQQQGVAQATGVVGRPTSPGTQILLTIVTLGIWAIVWTYRQYEDLKNYNGEGMGGGLAVVIAIFVGFLIPFLLANDVDTKLYQREGLESPVHLATGFWSLIPLVGGLIWYIKVQRAINDFWVSKGAVAPA
ncbi:MAG TPA: DUF4234 domain-containing protein [Acidimicrobiales bacterium]|jgi:hypothetical protein|nr:DUF4234 domain-containing protein [Acidimicrobiales bacterium]